jgi:hypothetical protein
MERLLYQLTLNNKEFFIRSNLPSDKVIGMNVDYNEFIQLLYSNRQEEKFNETIAREIHKTWTENEGVEQHSFKVIWAKLPYDVRLSNIRAARRIIEVVNSSGEFEVAEGTDDYPINEHPFQKRLNC